MAPSIIYYQHTKYLHAIVLIAAGELGAKTCIPCMCACLSHGTAWLFLMVLEFVVCVNVSVCL